MDVYGKPSVQNDRELYEDFKRDQARLREQYAGAATGTGKDKVGKRGPTNSEFHYAQMQKFSKYEAKSANPHENKFNIFDRQTTKQVPKTRDRFTSNPLAQLLNPDIKKREVVKDQRFKHDKLDISDIAGTNVDVYRKYKNL